ncbi:MAG: CpsB/CapC family capsule biosynthesis tyrosine phosphatase, partial [Lutibacter sp.]
MFSFFQKKTPLTSMFPEGFVDIHSHFLPAIDDGSKSMKESVALLRRMKGYGINHIICTPHVIESVWENASETIQHKLDTLNAHLKSTDFMDISLRAAAEYMLDANFNHLLKTEKLRTLKDNIVLVEMSYLNAPIDLYETLFNIQIAGYKPVLAHPERYSFYHNNYEEYKKLKEAGCLFQL